MSQNWDGQPAFKFDKDMDVPCIYCTIPRKMHLDVEWVHERYNKPEKATDWNGSYHLQTFS
jgi:hypothetical protein